MTLNDIAEQLKAATSAGGKLLLDNSIIQTDSWQLVLDLINPQVLNLTLNQDTDIYVENEILYVKGEGPLYDSSGISEAQIQGEIEADRVCELNSVIDSIELSSIPDTNMGLIDNPTLWVPSYSFSKVSLTVSSQTKTLNLGKENSAQTYDILPALKISLNDLGFSVSKIYFSSTLFNYTFDINGVFTISSIAIPVRVELPTSAAATQEWKLALEKKGDYLINLTDTFNLLGGVNAFQQMPAALTSVGGFGIKEMSVQFSETETVTSISSILVQFGCNDWTVVDGFQIKEAAVTISVNKPFQKEMTVTSMITGEFHLGTETPYIFTLSMFLGTGSQDWIMTLTANIPLDNISAFDALPGGLNVTELNLPEDVSTAELRVNEFTITYNPTSKTMGYMLLDVSLQAVWNFYYSSVGKPILGIGNPYLYLKIENPIPTPSDTANPNRVINLNAGGSIFIDTTTLIVTSSYSNAPTTWSFAIAQVPNSVLSLSSLVNKLLPDYNMDNLPDFVPSDIKLSGFSIKVYSDPATSTNNYEFKGETIVDWDVTVGTVPLSAKASFDVKYKSSGEVEGKLSIGATISQLDVTIGYEFKNTEKCLFVDWNVFKGSYCTADEGGKYVKIAMNDISFGGILEMLVLVVQPSLTSYSLPAPWSLLNEISLKGLTLKIDVSKKPYYVEVTYTLPKPINLGFLTIDALNFKKPDPDSGETSYVNIELSGSYLGGKPIREWKSPNEPPPEVPGEGNAYFDLRLLALGQRVSIHGFEDLKTIKEVITAMRDIPSTGGTSNPVDGEMKPGYPVFNNDSNWLIATNFGILKAGKDYTVDLSIVFNDPELYGLRIEMAGAKAKIFNGLKFEVMYKKVSDSVGMYQIELTLPDIMRYLQFGVVSIILPVIVIQIYTNGDFYFDIGFPHNNDFSRSFTATAIILGIPFRGSAGFYFGKLSNETATQIPETTLGTFNPVIIFGLGLQIGIGYDLQYGILKAGFSLMLAGIVEGVVAAFSPYESTDVVVADADKNQVEGSYYYKVSGTFVIIGKLYGSIDFGIIKADVTVKIYALVKGVFEAYREMILAISIGVEAKASIKINLGFFSIKISFSFSMTIEQEYTLGSNNEIDAPWYTSSAASALVQGRTNGQSLKRNSIRRPRRNTLQRKVLRREMRRQMATNKKSAATVYRKLATNTPWEGMVNRMIVNFDKQFNWTPFTLAAKDPLTVWLMPGLTVSGAQTGDLNAQQANYIATLYTDAPSDDVDAPKSSFSYLSENIFRWVINSWINEDPGTVTREELDKEAISLDDIQDAYDALTETTEIDPISYADIKIFLGQLFNINVATGKAEQFQGALLAMIPEFKLKVPAYNGQEGIERDFYTYSQCSQKYQEELRAYFNQLEVQVQEEMNTDDVASQMRMEEFSESLATFIFEDYFLLIAKQLLQDALDAMNAFTYTLAPNDSLDSILTWINSISREGISNDVTIPELIETSRTHILTDTGTSTPLLVAGVQYRIKQGQSLLDIAYDTAMDLSYMSAMNADNPAILMTDAQIELDNKIYIVPKDGTLQTAATFFEMTVSEMVTANEAEVGMDTALLNEGAWILLAACDYQALAEDTLEIIATTYEIDGTDLVIQNQSVAGLLVPGSTIAFEQVVYEVKSTDTFQSIANTLGTSVEILGADSGLQNQTGLLQPLAIVMIPPIDYAVQDGDTFQSIADYYAITAESLGNNFHNIGITAIFDTSEGNETLDLPPLEYLEVENVLNELIKGGKITSLAGMSSRYALHGLQLPITEDITFPDGAPCTQGTTCGVYKMTGQQWQLPDEFLAGTPYSFDIVKPDDLSWITFNGTDENTLTVIIDEEAGVPLITDVIDYARKNGAQPVVISLEIMPFAEENAGNYAFKSYMEWQSASPVALPYGSLGDQAVVTPLIWNFPSNLENLLSLDKIVSPKFGIEIGRSEEGSATMEQRSASYYGWGTLVPVQIKKLARQASNDDSFLNYELLGTNEVSIALLEQLLLVLRSGDGRIDQMQILYPPNATGNTPSGVQSDGIENLISFITQSNLSTDTNPPAGVSMARKAEVENQQLSRGILNDYYDFVRLLWQASITRNGGYSLYYELVSSQTGFSDEIFNEDDVATIYLLIGYANPEQNTEKNVLAPYMNCALTGETIDTSKEAVFAESKEQIEAYTAQENSKEETESLSQIAAKYYSNAIEVAQYNNDVALNLDANVSLTISNIVYELRPDENAPGNDLKAIIDYFGTNETALQEANIGVDLNNLSIWQILNIPPVTYNLATGGVAGTELKQIAAYYFIPLDLLAHENRALNNLFADGTELKINNQILIKTATIPQGNLGFEMVVRDPGEQTEVFDNNAKKLDTVKLAASDNADIYLRNLYTLLSYQVVGNNTFNQSIMGLPVGPTEDEENVENDIFNYTKVIPVNTYAKYNNILDQESLPLSAENPYAGIGGISQLHLDWRDLYGNITQTPLSNPDLNPKMPLNNPAAPIGYTDMLLGISQWPSVMTDYLFEKPDDAQLPKLSINFYFDCSRYEEDGSGSNERLVDTELSKGQQNAKDDLKTYTLLYYQLNQKDPSGEYLLKTYLTNTLNVNEAQELFDAQFQQILAFVNSIYQYLVLASQQTTPCTVTGFSIEQDINPETDIPAGDLIKLQVNLTFERPTNLVDTSFKEQAEVIRSVNEITPKTELKEDGAKEDKETLDMNLFAMAFEKAFLSLENYILKVATSNKLTTSNDVASNKETWIVRMGLNAEEGIFYNIGAMPYFYAPRPLWQALKTQPVNLYPYKSVEGINWNGTYQTKTVSGINMDSWGQIALQAIDNFLSPEYAAPAFIVDELSGGTYLSEILNAKESLAEAISNDVTNILETPVPTAGNLADAAERYKQKLLVALGNAYQVTALVQYDVDTLATYTGSIDTVTSPRLFGTPIASIVSDDDAETLLNQEFSLSTAKIALPDKAVGKESNLSFFFTTRNPKARKSILLELNWNASHLEHDIHNVAEIDGYEASNWLTFVLPNASDDTYSSPLKKDMGAVEIPIILRAYPTPPSLNSQDYLAKDADTGSETTVKEASLWDYTYQYATDHAAQDKINNQIRFNIMGTDFASSAMVNTLDLFEELAQFTNVYPAIQQDFIESLSKLNGKTDASDEEYRVALGAVKSFSEICNRVAEAWSAWRAKNMNTSAKMVSETSSDYIFTISEESASLTDNELRVTIELPKGLTVENYVRASSSRLPALLNDRDIFNLPVVEIDSDLYKAILIPDTTTYHYESLENPGEYLDFDSAQNIPNRRLLIKELSVFNYQNAWSSVAITRNGNLMSDDSIETNPEFIYKTPLIKFANKLIPLLVNSQDINIAKIPDNVVKGRSLSEHLIAFLQNLLEDSLLDVQAIKIEVTYSYKLADKRALSSIVLPVLLLPVTTIPLPGAYEPEGGSCPLAYTEDSAFVCKLAVGIDQWFDRNKPNIHQAKFCFDVALFSELNETQLPLIRLRKVYLDEKDVVW